MGRGRHVGGMYTCGRALRAGDPSHSTRDTLVHIRSRTSLGNRLRSSSITFDAPSVGLIERTWATALSRTGTSLSLSVAGTFRLKVPKEG